MAKQSAKKTELVKAEEPQKFAITPITDSAPAHIAKMAQGEQTGMEGLGKDDYKTPRVTLLQGLSPELETFADLAKKDHFWHTGMNVNLGKEFLFIPLIAAKRVILWRPRNDSNGGILAFSKDGKNWDSGANQEFLVRIKGRKDPVVWKTGKDVLNSRLTEFGTSNPDDPRSAPAAGAIYEYLSFLPNFPELSPCVIGAAKTATPNGKTLNTSLMMQARKGYHISNFAVKCFVEETSNNEGEWTILNFRLEGFINKDFAEQMKMMREMYADYKVEYTQDETSTETLINDKINF